jgi:hypothetical protein
MKKRRNPPRPKKPIRRAPKVVHVIGMGPAPCGLLLYDDGTVGLMPRSVFSRGVTNSMCSTLTHLNDTTAG